MFQSNVPKLFWNFAVAHAVYIMNRIPNSFLNMTSPFERPFGAKPALTSLKIFGCKAFASTLVAHRKKLDPRARACVYLGVKPGTKGFVLYDVNTREIFISRHVRFHEFVFPFMHPTIPATPLQPRSSHSDTAYYDTIFPSNDIHMHDQSYTADASHSHPMPLPASQPQLRHSTRSRRTPSYLQDYHCNLAFSHQADPTSVNQACLMAIPILCLISFLTLVYLLPTNSSP